LNVKLLAAALAAILVVFAAAAPAATRAPQANPLAGAGAHNWLTVVDTKGGGHAIGNPQAKVKLTEFVSYTCPHCGHFAAEAANAVDLYVASGKVQLDVRHVIRDPVDLTAAMLAECGPAIKFPRNHAALFAAQPKWLPIVARSTPAQQARWTSGPGGQRRRAIASDMGFYDLMATRGYERVELDRCLNDEALAKRLADQSAADDKKWDISSTPSFAIDGTLLAGTWEWSVLRPQLDARL
jgi:protein-disulfide isomerase